jgi:hypothetical protein
MRYLFTEFCHVAAIAWLLSIVFEGVGLGQKPPAVANLAGLAPELAAKKLYVAAVEAELAGRGQERNVLLRQAVGFVSDYGPARWRLGELRDGDVWRTVDDVADRWALDGRLVEYEARRNAATDDLPNNLALARWAKKSALFVEAAVHWRRVLRDQADNEEAARSLGLKKLNGRWLPHEEYKAGAAEVRRAKRAAKFWKPQLASIRRDLMSLDADERALGLASLRAITERDALPTLQAEFSLADPREPFREVDENAATFKRDKTWNLEYVALLSRWPEVEATKALVREAVLSPIEDVRLAAADELSNRPAHHYVPRLLAGMVAPIDARITITLDGAGRVFYRRTFFREGPLADAVATYDDFYQNFVAVPVFFADGYVEDTVIERPVPRAQVNALAGEATAVRAAVETANWNIERMNTRIVEAAHRATGVDLPVDATEWWSWWQDYNELYVPAMKPLYERTYANYYAPYPVAGYHYPVSCFAAGTRVMTKVGSRPIETIRVGDSVLAQDPATGELAFKAVLDRTTRPPEELLAITLGQQAILVTRGHPFWVDGENWQMAKHLRVGDRLHTTAGPTPITEIVEEAPAKTYNLVVDDWHNYFVGDRRVLVHDNTPQRATVMRLPGVR